MAVLKSSDFLAVMFSADTALTIDPNGTATAVTWPANQVLMSTKDIDFTGTAMVMKYPQFELSGFVIDDVVTL